MLCFMYVNVLLTSAAICINEGVPAAAVEDDECRIINENTIFDHIREKAKNLPVLTSPERYMFTIIRDFKSHKKAHSREAASC